MPFFGVPPRSRCVPTASKAKSVGGEGEVQDPVRPREALDKQPRRTFPVRVDLQGDVSRSAEERSPDQKGLLNFLSATSRGA